jgi:hypothetical protein
MSCQCEELAARLLQFEKAQVRLRRQGAAFAIVLLGCLALGAQPTGTVDSVEARRFVLRDANGAVRATLGAESRGYGGIHGDAEQASVTSLRFFDRLGSRRAVLETSWDFAGEDPMTSSSLWLLSKDSRDISRGVSLFGSGTIRADSQGAVVTMTVDSSGPAIELRRRGLRGNVDSELEGTSLGLEGLVSIDAEGRRARK